MITLAENTCGPFLPSVNAQRLLILPLICAIAVIPVAGLNLPAMHGIGGIAPQSGTPAVPAPALVLPEASAAIARWAASPLILSAPSGREAAVPSVEPARAIVDRQDRRTAVSMAAEPTMVLAAGATALLGISLLESMIFAMLHTTARRRRNQHRKASAISRPVVDYEDRSRQLFYSVSVQWKRAETSVFDLNEALPLRALLFNELKLISQRLAMDPGAQGTTKGAVTVYQSQPYWKLLSQRLQQSARDLDRISAVAEAAGVGFGSRHSEPRIPKTKDEACFILGANRNADADTLQRLVRALRQCWHPDLAQTDQDRGFREARLKQINAAHDLITGKRAEG